MRAPARPVNRRPDSGQPDSRKTRQTGGFSPSRPTPKRTATSPSGVSLANTVTWAPGFSMLLDATKALVMEASLSNFVKPKWRSANTGPPGLFLSPACQSLTANSM